MGITEGAGARCVTAEEVSSFQFQVSSKNRNAHSPVADLIQEDGLRLPTSDVPFRSAKGWGASPSRERRGLWVVLLGPDGAGKSSVIAGLASSRWTGFAGCATYHLRPTFWRKQKAPIANCDPHGQPARGTLVTLLKLFCLLVANWLACWVKVRPQLVDGKLVLFDRYFSDCLFDPRRYRLPESCRRLTTLVVRLLPEPDLYVVLDAPASLLQERKSEVTLAESARQREAYSAEVSGLANVAVVDAARPVAEVVAEVLDHITEVRLARCHNRHQVA
jgi:thymidylate kinase